MISVLHGTVPIHELYARALTSAWRNPLRILDPAFAEQKEPEAWDKIRRDTKIAQAIFQRKAAVAGAQWVIQPGGDTDKDILLADIVEDALKKIRLFRAARMRLVNAIFRGRAFEYIEGDRRAEDLGGTGLGIWWVPLRLRNVSKWRMQTVPRKDSTGRITGVTQFWSVASERWEVLHPEQERAFLGITYDDEEEDLGYGRGLLDSLYFMWWVKQQVMREGLQGLERWAQGMVVGRIKGAGGGGGGQDPETRRARMAAQLSAHSSRHFLTVDGQDEVEVITGGAEGHQMVQSFLDYCDRAILGLVMGSVLPFGGSEGVGSLARAEEESETTDQVIQSDRETIDEVITDRLIEQFLRLNRPRLFALGLNGRPRPRFETVQQKKIDTEKEARVVDVLLKAAVPLKQDEVYERIGYTAPGVGDRVFRGPPLLAPGLGGGGGGGFDGGLGGGVRQPPARAEAL